MTNKDPSCCCFTRAYCRNQYAASQHGTVLLAFILILITGTSYFLLIKLNTAKQLYHTQQRQTLHALQRAKQALIGYAVLYPELNEFGPGYLPCPDGDKDGVAETACSAKARTTIGRFPFKTLETAELRDSSGTRLWYALADNYKNNPKLQPLNSETPGQLSINAAQDDIIAVIIAPGAPIADQERDPEENDVTKEITHYLEQDNQYLGTEDAKYTHFVSLDPANEHHDGGNDHILTITRADLMKIVEKRVLGEAGKALVQHKKDYGAYPGLFPFTDPKAEARSGNEDAVLLKSTCPGTLTGVSTVADQTILQDSCIGNDFKEKNSEGTHFIAAGDVIDIVGKGSAIIDAVSTQGLVVRLTQNMQTPQIGNDYRIRRNYGKIGKTAPTKLYDANKKFKAVKKGDIVIIKHDGISFGRVKTAEGDGLTVDRLYFSEENKFTEGKHYYLLPQSNLDKGQLATHKPHGTFFSPFDITWKITTPDEIAITVVDEGAFSTGRQQKYIAALEATLKATTKNTAPVSINTGLCAWGQGANDVDCIGLPETAAAIKIDGRITTEEENKNTIEDNNAAFEDAYIKRGDIVQNYDDRENTVLSDKTIKASSHGIATTGSKNTVLMDESNNFEALDIYPGDIIYNKTDGARGTVVMVADKNTLITTALTGGGENTFSEGNAYQLLDTTRLLLEEDVDLIDLGIKPYQYTIADSTSGERYIVSAVHNKRLLSAVPLPGGEAIRFTIGKQVTIRRAATTVVTKVFGQHTLETAQISGYEPDFDCPGGVADDERQCLKGERYRIIRAAAKLTVEKNACVNEKGALACTNDKTNQLILKTVRLGDIVENETDGAFGRITAITETSIEAQLYGGKTNKFQLNDRYHIYYDYAYYREYRIAVKYQGRVACPPDGSGQRTRTVCTTKEPAESSACTLADTCLSEATALIDGQGEPLLKIDVIDYEEDQKTAVAHARFLPSEKEHRGALKTAHIRYYLHHMYLPQWFIQNDWHRLIYIDYNRDCAAGHCLKLRGKEMPENTAIIVTAGAATSTQDRTKGLLENYFESFTPLFDQGSRDNDQVTIIETNAD